MLLLYQYQSTLFPYKTFIQCILDSKGLLSDTRGQGALPSVVSGAT